MAGGKTITWNEIRFRLDPPEGIDLISGGVEHRSSSLDRSAPPGVSEYDALLEDLTRSRRSLFVPRGFNESAWKMIEPLLDPPLGRGGRVHPYDVGSAGPRSSGGICPGAPDRG